MTNRKTPVPQSYPTLEFEMALRSLRTNKARRPTPMLPPAPAPAACSCGLSNGAHTVQCPQWYTDAERLRFSPAAEAYLDALEASGASELLPAPSEPSKFSFPMPPSSTEEWFDVPVDVDSLFDSIRLADAMMIEAEDAEDAAPESTQRSRIAQVADRCNGGDL